MEIVIIMIPLSLIVSGLFVYSFIWSTRNGQFDDLETPAYRMLMDEKESKIEKQKIEKKGKGYS